MFYVNYDALQDSPLFVLCTLSMSYVLHIGYYVVPLKSSVTHSLKYPQKPIDPLENGTSFSSPLLLLFLLFYYT